MFIDANEVGEGATIDSDVCIVGAGAAGITMAVELAKQNLNVTLLESGGLKFDKDTQALCKGVNIVAYYAHEHARLRYFGGSTNHWGGQCRRLSAIDFEKQSWSEWTGWPFPKSTLDPYYEKALDILDITRGYDDFADCETGADAYPRLLGPGNWFFEPIIWLHSPPTRMGKKYHGDIAESGKIRCYLNANAIELESDRNGATVTKVKAKTLAGRTLEFGSKRFVLCGGAIENARLLLISRSTVSQGLGNQNDLVGRFFGEHIVEIFNRRTLFAVPPGKKGFQEEHLQTRVTNDDVPISHRHFGFAATRACQEQHSLMGFSVSFRRRGKPRRKTARADLIELMKLLPTPERGTATREVFPYSMIVQAEQAPNANNRVYLSSELDALGVPRIALDWRGRSVDDENVLKGLRFFARELQKAGNGRIRLPQADDLSKEGARIVGHQMGTTRMANDAKRGVTDGYGKVHGVANLYIASNSLFPTGGYVNPTLTLIALTLRVAERVADHDKQAPSIG